MSGFDCDVVVVGAGPAGLSCAVRLLDAGVDVRVLEKGQQAGGNVQTLRAGEFLVEKGPHTFMASADDLIELAERTGLNDRLVVTSSAARKRFIVRGGKMYPVFTGPLSFLTSRLLGFRGKMRLATEPFRTRRRGRPGESAAEFFERRFGKEAARILAGAFVAGVYAGDIDRLEAQSAFPLFWSFEQEHGSMIRGAFHHARQRRKLLEARGRKPMRVKGLLSFAGGMGTMTGVLAGIVGDRLQLGCDVELVERKDGGYVVSFGSGQLRARAVVLAVPPSDAARLAGKLDAELAGIAGAVPMAPVMVVHLGFERRQEVVPDGFGFLAPRGQGIRCLGILFPSRLFADRTPEGGDLLTAYLGGMTDPGALELGDDAARNLIMEDLHRLCGNCDDPAMIRVMRHPRAIPQMVIGHAERMRLLRGRLTGLPGFLLAGNWLKGVGLKDAVASGLEAAEQAVGLIRKEARG